MKHAALGILLFTAASRLLRAACRWDEWALHYATYNWDTRGALLGGDLVGSLSTWVGLHPPGYPLLNAVISLSWPAPAAWLLASALASTVAVWALLKAHPRTVVPALFLATDPVQLHYAAEVNNYPLGTMVLALAWMAHRRDKPVLLGVVAFLACWTHILVAVGVGIIAALSRYRAALIGVMTLSAIILVPEAWRLAMDAGSHRQPALDLELSLRDAIDRFGLSWLILFPVLLLGISGAVHAAVLWSGLVFVWGAAVWMGTAAPHQFPYACFLGIPASALVAAAIASRPRLIPFLCVLLVGRGLMSASEDGKRLLDISQDQEHTRAIDVVLEKVRPGDAIVLVRGPGAPDDDKRHTSPVLWRLNPFTTAIPIDTIRSPAFEGHPFIINGVRVYTFAHPRPVIGHIRADRVFTILYDGAEQNPDRIPAHDQQGPWEAVGPDRWRGPIGS